MKIFELMKETFEITAVKSKTMGFPDKAKVSQFFGFVLMV